MTQTRKLLLFSDPHLTGSDDAGACASVTGKLQAAIAQAQRRHSDAEHVIFCGDLSDDGTPAGYDALKEACAGISFPITYLMGNEDNRDRFSAVFSDVARDVTGHFQYVLRFGTHAVICLDTLDQDPTPKHSGLLCADRLAWLDQALAENAQRFVTVIMHHPPVPLRMPAMDQIGLRNGSDVVSRLRSAGVALVLTGHVHRTVSTVSHGLTCQMVNSTAFGIALTGVGENLSLDPTHVPSYSVLLLSEGGATLHTESVAD